MNKKAFFFSIAAVLMALAFCLSGCNADSALKVKSYEFNELKAEEPNAQWIQNRWFAGETNCYNGPIYTIDFIDNEIVLERFSEEKTHICDLDYRYLVGADMGEFGGWVTVSEHYSDNSGERILKENCKGFLKAPHTSDESEQTVYIFTGLSHLDTDEGKIYRFSNSEGGFNAELLCDIGSEPEAFVIDGDKVIVATGKALVSVDSNGKATELFTAEYWKDLHCNSMFKHENGYYIGTASGILKYCTENGEVIWYPYYN